MALIQRVPWGAMRHFQTRWRVWLLIAGPGLLLLLALALTLRWFWSASEQQGVHPLPQAQFWVESLPNANYDTAGLASLAQHPLRSDQATWQPLRLPLYQRLPARADLAHPKMGRLWMRAHLPTELVAQVGTDNLALYLVRAMGGAVTVWVNGELVFINLDQWRTQWNQPLLVPIPRHLLASGQALEIQIALPFLEAQGYSVGSIYVGQHADLQTAYDLRVLFQRTVPQVGMIVIAIMGVLSLQFWLVRRQETEHLLTAAICMAWLVCNLQYFFDFENDLWSSKWFGSIVDSAVAWVMVLLTVFIVRFQKHSFKKIELGLMCYALVTSVVTLPVWDWETNALTLQHGLDVAIACLICPFLTWLAWRDKRSELWALSLSVWSMLLLGAYDTFGLTSQVNPNGVHLFPYATILVFMALTFATQRRHILALKTSDDMTASLQSDLDRHREQYERELDRLSQIELIHLRQVERERLRLDLHKHLNHNIHALLRRVQSEQCAPKDLAMTLGQCFNETRMLIESLEPVNHDVETLLGTMRPRLEVLLKQQGVALTWNLGLVQPLPWLEAPHCLLLLRWVDEAVQMLLSLQGPDTLAVLTREEASSIAIILRVSPCSAAQEIQGPLANAEPNTLQGLASMLGGRTEQTHEGRMHKDLSLVLPIDRSNSGSVNL
jgi:signal transduction histidine kinase